MDFPDAVSSLFYILNCERMRVRHQTRNDMSYDMRDGGRVEMNQVQKKVDEQDVDLLSFHGIMISSQQ